MEKYIDDHDSQDRLSKIVNQSPVLLIAPGKNYKENISIVKKESQKDCTIISVGFVPSEINVDYVFCSNLRKYEKVKTSGAKIIATSNIKNALDVDLIFNYTSYLSDYSTIIDNGGLMILKILRSIGVKEVSIAGMDGYTVKTKSDNYSETYISSKETIEQINHDMAIEISKLRKDMKINFLTKSRYEDI